MKISKSPMRIRVRALFVAILLLYCAHPALAGGPFFELDQLLVEAGSVANFVANTPEAGRLRERYFKRLQAYYGEEKLPRASFEKIVEQMRAALIEMPELEKMLWSTEGLGRPYSFTVPLASSGLDLKPEAWLAHLDVTERQLAENAADLLRLSESERQARIRAIRERWQGRFDEYQNALAWAEGLPSAQRRAQQAALSRPFREALERDADYRQLAAYESLLDLRESKLRQLKGPGAADFALQQWEQFMTGRLERAVGVGTDRMPAELASFGRKMLLQPLETPALEVVDRRGRENALFRVRTLQTGDSIVPEGRVSGTFQAVPVPRRFHAVWRGIPLNECVGGGCDHVATTTPRRWALAAIENVQVHNIEKDGSYHGYVQMVPIEDRISKNVYGAIDILSPTLTQRVAVLDEDGVAQLEPLLRTWLQAAYSEMPKEWKGLVVGDNRSVNNARGQTTLQSSAEYILAEPLHGEAHINRASFATYFRTGDDEFAKRLLALSTDPPGQGANKYYAGGLTFDAALTEGGIYLLRPEAARLPTQEALARVLKELEACLHWPSCMEHRAHSLVWWTARMPQTPEVGRMLQKYSELDRSIYPALAAYAENRLLLYPEHLAATVERIRARIAALFDSAKISTELIQVRWRNPEAFRELVAAEAPHLLNLSLMGYSRNFPEEIVRELEALMRERIDLHTVARSTSAVRFAQHILDERKKVSDSKLWQEMLAHTAFHRRMAIASYRTHELLPLPLKEAILGDLRSAQPERRAIGLQALQAMAVRGPLDRKAEAELAKLLAMDSSIAQQVEEIRRQANARKGQGRGANLGREGACQRAWALIPRVPVRYIERGIFVAGGGYLAYEMLGLGDKFSHFYQWRFGPQNLWTNANTFQIVRRNADLETRCSALDMPRESSSLRRYAISSFARPHSTQRKTGPAPSIDIMKFSIYERAGTQGDRLVVQIRPAGEKAAEPVFSQMIENDRNYDFSQDLVLYVPPGNFTSNDPFNLRLCIFRGGELHSAFEETVYGQ